MKVVSRNWYVLYFTQTLSGWCLATNRTTDSIFCFMSRNNQKNRFDLLFHVSQKSEELIWSSILDLAANRTTDSIFSPNMGEVLHFLPYSNFELFQRIKNLLHWHLPWPDSGARSTNVLWIWYEQKKVILGEYFADTSSDELENNESCAHKFILYTYDLLTYLLYRCPNVIWSPLQLFTCLIRNSKYFVC